MEYCSMNDDKKNKNNDLNDNIYQLPEILTPEQVQSYLQISRAVFLDLVQKGSIPGIIDLGGILRIKRDSFVEWVDQGGTPVQRERKMLKLHEAILETLHRHGNCGMTVKDIADYIENHELYHKKMANPSSQVSARIHKYLHLFEVDASVRPRLIRAAT